MAIRAALYLRSSKDRKDVSIDTQRNALTELAASRSIQIAAEYIDVVESGKDDDRPGYQALVRQVRDRQRGWTHLLINDTARLSRRRMISMIFEEQECLRHGVTVIYRSVPEGDDPATTMILRSIMQAFDEHHSMVSRQKGLGGMAENVRKGFRAGGRAPLGYRLKAIDTGIVREGKSVTKSVLEPDEKAEAVKRYLKARAAGRSRLDARDESGLRCNKASYNGIEHNALTYAGATVWNVHREAGSGQARRRPRSEWVVNHDTHEALITTDEAEQILAALGGRANGPEKMGLARRSLSDQLLSGLLVSPAGVKWDVAGRENYRHRVVGQPSRYVQAGAVERFVLDFVRQEMTEEAFVHNLIDFTAKKEVSDQPRKQLQKRLIALNGEIERTVALACQMSEPAPVLRRVATLESQRDQLLADQERADLEIREARMLARITPQQVRQALQDLSERLETTEPRVLKAVLRDLLEKVELDPADLSLRIHYRLAVNCRLGMAFPRGFEPLYSP